MAYVGIKRAKRELDLTNDLTRMNYGRNQVNPASRFIEEIDPALLESENQQAAATNVGAWHHHAASRSFNSRQSEVIKRSAASVQAVNPGTGAQKTAWKVGEKVWHKAWGQGTIVKVAGNGEDLELDIAFPSKGIKRLLAAFAPIKKQQ